MKDGKIVAWNAKKNTEAYPSLTYVFGASLMPGASLTIDGTAIVGAVDGTVATVDVALKGLAAKNTVRIEGTGEGFNLDWIGLLK